jgi:acyl carrier protein
MALENIKEAAVVSRQGESELEESYLVAYIVPAEKLSLSITMLRRALGEKLPDYMVPSTFVFLDALPLTATGKVDRRAFPAPDQHRPELESPFMAPRTPAGEALAKIWAEVLALDQVGIHDNFFDLGGHSLSATQVISRVREAFHIELSLRALFEKPTIEELARHPG